MEAPPGLARYLAWAGLAAVFFAIAIASAFALVDLDTIAWLRAAKPTEQLVPGPAIYRGRLYGPEARAAPDGSPAVLFRAWVEPTDDDSSGEFCVSHEHDGVYLVTHAGVRHDLGWLAGARDIPLLDGDVTKNLGKDTTVIELATTGAPTVEGFPGSLGACADDDRASRVRLIAPGAEVEVVACSRDGALAPCDGTIEDVIAVRSIRAHVSRRATSVAIDFRLAFGASLLVLGFLGLVARTQVAAAFERLRVRSGSEAKA